MLRRSSDAFWALSSDVVRSYGVLKVQARLYTNCTKLSVDFCGVCNFWTAYEVDFHWRPDHFWCVRVFKWRYGQASERWKSWIQAWEEVKMKKPWPLPSRPSKTGFTPVWRSEFCLFRRLNRFLENGLRVARFQSVGSGTSSHTAMKRSEPRFDKFGRTVNIPTGDPIAPYYSL